MKKLLFCLVFSCTTILVSAINVTTNLNPFAYNLSAELSADQTTLTVKYCLNADVTSLEIVFLKGEEVVKRFPVTDDDKHTKTTADDPYLAASSHSVDVQINDLGTGTFAWRIEVKGVGRNVVERYNQVYSFYLPSSVDIVKDPTSFNYGKVIVVESSHSGLNNASYHSSSTGAGLYVFNPDFTYRKNRQKDPGFNGGSATWGDISNQYFVNTKHAPRRVRVSEDGRIFVSSMYEQGSTLHKYQKGIVLWEVDAYFSKWNTVMGHGVGGAKYDISSIYADQKYYYKNQLLTSGGDFIAAPNAGLDVRGRGENLKLLLLSCDYRAFANNHQGFMCCEYNLGTNTTWSTTPSKDFVVNDHVFATSTNSNVQYDKDGGIWCISNRGVPSNDQPALVHKTSSVTEDYRNTTRANSRNAGFRFNGDFTKVIMATVGQIGRVYDYYSVKQNGNYFSATFTDIDMSAVGTYINDFAWDNANNIYAVGNNNGVTSGGNGHVAVYCLPYSNSDVFTTPGPSDFTINCQEGLKYTVTTTVNDPAMGSVTGGGTIQSCTLCTVEATPNTNYRFVNWTMGGEVVSTDNPYTFMVTDDITITANFAPAVFNVTWHNLLKSTTDPSNIDVDNTAELWELFMPIYNDYTYEKRESYTRATQALTATGLLTWFAVSDNNHYTSLYNAMTNDDSPFVWLRDFIISVAGKPTSSGNQNIAKEWVVELVGFFLQTKYTHSSYGLTSADYSGTTDQWTPYYREYVCGLTKTMNYADDMPTSIDSYAPIKNASQIQAAGSGRPYALPTWYVSNDAVANPNQLLAWRLNSTDGKIIHKVDDDMALYATWVDKTISENKDNTDVIRLMQNSGYKNNPHALTVDRKLQAGMYNTICFPFTVYINDQTDNGVPHSGLAENHPLKGATVLNLIGTDKLYDESGDPVVVLNFEQVNKLEAGKPYLIKLAENQPSITEPIPFTGVAYDDLTYINGHQTITTDDGTISFHGMINPGVVTVAADAPTLILVDQNRLAVVSQNGAMKGLRGYFTLSPEMASLALDGRCYLSISKPAPTDVEVLTDPQPKARQQVQKIMRNGQIFIIRDGETYTITGQKVR